MKNFLIIDANNLIHRAYHGYGQISNKNKDYIVEGFDKMLLKLLFQFQPDYLAVVFDGEEKTFRHKIYSEYKANREEKSEDFVRQSYLIKKNVEKTYPFFKSQEYEADDIIATLTKKAESHGSFLTTIVSGDKDLAQLVSGKTMLYNGQSKKYIGVDEVLEKYGVNANSIIDYLALIGDQADNVPGLYKCGPATAKNLINRFKTVENIIKNFNNVDECIKPKTNINIIKKQLEEEKEKLILAKRLITLVDNISIDLKLKDIKYKKSPQDSIQKKSGFKRKM